LILAALCGLAAAICWGVSDFISRQPSRRIGYYITSTYVQLFSFIGLFVLVLVTIPSSLAKIPQNQIVFAENLIIGVLMFGALLFLYRGYAQGMMSITGPISSSYPVVTIILSVVILGVTLADITAIGITIVVIGIILAGFKISDLRTLINTGSEKMAMARISSPPSSLSSQESGRKMLVRGVDSAILACLFLGVIYLGLGSVTKVYGTILPILVMRGSAAIVGFALLLPLKQKFVLPSKKVLPWLLLLATLDSTGLLLFDRGITIAQNSLPIVVTLSGLVGVVTLLLARTFYKERLDTIQGIGVIILLVGVGIVLYF
jgi:drug/metabolite transporter (DMT)-like permease